MGCERRLHGEHAWCRDPKRIVEGTSWPTKRLNQKRQQPTINDEVGTQRQIQKLFSQPTCSSQRLSGNTVNYVTFTRSANAVLLLWILTIPNRQFCVKTIDNQKASNIQNCSQHKNACNNCGLNNRCICKCR